MGKAAMCIQLLQILSSGRVYKCSELAELMETNPRNIIEYKRELEEVGYYILSIPGRYGGYQLDQTATIPSLKLTAIEKMAFVEGVAYLKSRTDFPYGMEYISATSKIFSSLEKKPIEEDIVVSMPRKLAMPIDEIAERYRVIAKCIQEHRVMSIRFLTNYNLERDRLIHPYKLFMYNDAWFVLALCESPRRVMPFKLNRIISYKETFKKFRQSILYNEHDYFNELGLKGDMDWSQYGKVQSAEWFHIKLELHGRPAMYVKEYIYGKNQIVTAINKNTTILECDMHYRYNTVHFVLGFGVDCHIIEPQWLKDEIKQIAKSMWEANDEE